MTRLPTPGSDSGAWGDILNEYLSQAHKADGTLKDNVVGSAQLKDNAITNAQLANGSVQAVTIADGAVSNAKLDTPTKASVAKAETALQSVPSATSGAQGTVQLAGDLAGTADAPTVTGGTHHGHTTAQVSVGVAPPPATSVTVSALETRPRVTDTFGGYLWEVNLTGVISRSSDKGATWAAYSTLPLPTSIRRMMPTSDGEVIAFGAERIYKSAGWASGSPTWSVRATPNGTCTFQSWGFDGDGTRFITTEYSGTRSDSRYVRMTFDAGDTWTVVYDSVARYGDTLASGSHLHACCYDPWADRWYVAEGHDDGGAEGDIAGIYCSTDNGATWTRAPGMKQNPAPTVMVATRDGLVCGSDHANNGMYGVRRETDPAKESLRAVWRWRTGRDGLVGFASRGFLHAETGIVYMSWTTAFADVAPIITGGTVEAGGLVWTWPTLPVTNSDLISPVVPTDSGHFRAVAGINGSVYEINGSLGIPASTPPSVADTGVVLGGTTAVGTSTAVGPRSTTGAAIRSVSVGSESDASNIQDNVAVGYSAKVVGNSAVAVGSSATAGALGVVIGRSATSSTNGEGVVIGASASVTGGSSTAVGRSATAAATGVAIGYQANAATGVAIGLQAKVNAHSKGIALGNGSSTTAPNQLQIADRHIEMAELAADPAAAPANSARLFVRDNGSGKTQLCVRFNTGAVQVITIEP